jgi:hypothetical protein
MTCGVGCDTLVFLLKYDPWQLFAIDNQDKEEHGVLEHNLSNIVNLFPETYQGGVKEWIKTAGKEDGAWNAKISLHSKSSGEFLKQYGKFLGTQKRYEDHPIFFYADPTWNVERLIKYTLAEKQQRSEMEVNKYGRYGENEETLMNEGSPEMIMNYIVTCILQPAFANGVPVDVLCVKVRWDISQ